MNPEKGAPAIVADSLPRSIFLAWGTSSIASRARLAVMSLLSMAVDLALFILLLSIGVEMGEAHLLSFSLASAFFYFSLALPFFSKTRPNQSVRGGWSCHSSFGIVVLLSLFLRGGVLTTFTGLMGWPPQVAILPAMAIAFFTNYLGCTLFVFPAWKKDGERDFHWKVLAFGVIGYTLLLRLFYLSEPNLLSQEAYYWNYAQHLDIGYLDHPPMVGWIIWLGTTLLGDTEMGTRLGAFLAWLLTAFFCFRITRHLFDHSTALRALVLLAILPFFFGVGLVMTPDALVVPCWAGLLYFLERSLLGGRRSAWLGVAVSAGLGMLSKYTIALLAPGVLLFMMIDRDSRRWLFRLEPYAALALTLLLFSPVIIWNAEHQWASFVFQGPSRFQESLNFTLPELLGSVFVLLTPTGALAALAALRSKAEGDAEGTDLQFGRRRRSFLLIFTLLPLSIFAAFSLFHNVKLNWTGPLWLAVLPPMAWQMAPHGALRPNRLLGILHRSWPPTIMATPLLFGALLHFWVLGLPGISYPRISDLDLLVGWKDLTQKVSRIENQVQTSEGVKPVVVGMDKSYIASQLIFCGARYGDGNGDKKEIISHTTGRHIFGEDSLMYRYWFPDSEIRNLPREHPVLILIARELSELRADRILASGWTMGRVRELDIQKNGMTVGHYYYTLAKPK